jgi:hypothetical protein
MTRYRAHLIVLAALLALCLWPTPVKACEPEPITPNTPTGIAGCERWGTGVASHYGPGTGVAMNFCTWELRHSTGCGSVAIQSLATGITVTVPVVDFCDCWTTTKYERIVDLQYSVVSALGLNLSDGLYKVNVQPATGPVAPVAPVLLPNTATEAP